MKLPTNNRLSVAGIIIITGYFLLTILADTSICCIRAFSGYPCPGCGMTTAVMQLIQGNIYGAWQSNAMIFALPPAGIVYLVNRKFLPEYFPRLTIAFLLFLAGVMIIYFIVRLSMYYPTGEYPMNRTSQTIPNYLIEKIRDLRN